jgi:transcriptional regulator with XRE-family HTH domain
MNQKLEKVLRVLKQRGLEQSTSDAELAKLAGLSRNTISQSKAAIQSYLLSAPSPSASDEAFVDKQCIETFVDIALASGIQERHFAQVTGAVAGFVLRHHTDLINNIKTPKKIVRVGQAYLSLVTQIESRKGINGTPIHSNNKDAKYLLTELNNSTLIVQLFSRSNSYRADKYSKSWKLTVEAEQLNKLIMQETMKLISIHVQQAKVTHFPQHTGTSICSDESVNQESSPNLSVEDLFIEIPVQALGALSVRSFLQVMDIAEPSPPSCVAVPLKNLASVNPGKGRTYNIFTRLRSSERKALGYHNYDISGGLQMICFNILYLYPPSKYQDFHDLQDAYPLIFEYGNDPVAKQKLRQYIANDLGVSIDEVKELLTAYANGSQKQVDSSSKLQEFFEQSDQLRREVTAAIASHEDDLLESAITQSKKTFPEDIDWQSMEKEKSAKEAQDKASVFFFIWTYFEKQIRDAMLSVVDDGIPVHDAIYSKLKLPFSDFEGAVFEHTRFDVKIGG